MSTRMRRPRAWLTTLTLSVGMVMVSQLAVLHGRGADTKRTSGIYLESAEGGTDEPKRLDATMVNTQVEGLGASMASMGFKKPKLISKLSGDKATLRVPAGSSFLFVFGASMNRGASPDMDPMAAMAGMKDSMSQLSPQTSSPKDYMLAVFVVADGERVYNSGSGKQVKCKVTNVESKVFRVKPEAPLEPGEYAFAYAMNGGGGGAMWDFGVDGASTK